MRRWTQSGTDVVHERRLKTCDYCDKVFMPSYTTPRRQRWCSKRCGVEGFRLKRNLEESAEMDRARARGIEVSLP